jgi:pimeloyl-ACP methyl ester carboxylesterase
MDLTDHAGVRLTHGKPEVNGVEIHYAIGGAGEPVFLLHGTPKTMSYWRHVVPLLTPHYTVIAVDNRGAGGSQRPLTGYDTATMAGAVNWCQAIAGSGGSQGLPAMARLGSRSWTFDKLKTLTCGYASQVDET